jgi:sec-independent protein translocase protein TatA
MGTFSIWHWLIVLAVVLVLFGGGGKISKLMGDFGKGLKSFKKNVKEETSGDADDDGDETKSIEGEAASASVSESTSEEKDRAASG